MKTKEINPEQSAHEIHTPGFRLVVDCQKLGFSVPQLAQECGMDKSRRTFYKIFHEGHAPSARIVRSICDRFPQINYDYIFTGVKSANEVQKNVLLNASFTEQNISFDQKEQDMINGFIKLENELVRTSNALQTTLLNCTNQIQELVLQNAKTKNDFETHIIEFNKQLGALAASHLKLSNQIVKVEGRVQEMHHDSKKTAIKAQEYITESQQSHKRNLDFQQEIIPDLGEYRNTKKKS